MTKSDMSAIYDPLPHSKELTELELDHLQKLMGHIEDCEKDCADLAAVYRQHGQYGLLHTSHIFNARFSEIKRDVMDLLLYIQAGKQK